MDRRSAVQIIVFSLLSLLGYIWLGYGTIRSDFCQLAILFGFLSGLYLLGLYRKVFDVGFPLILCGALLLRASLMFMTPNLTDDYFRYIWDGLLFTDRKSTRLNSSHGYISYAVFC